MPSLLGMLITGIVLGPFGFNLLDNRVVAKRLSVKYGKLWVAAEVFLFVLVGATVNIQYLGKVGAKAFIVIIGALAFRMFGVFICLLGTSLKKKERLFTMMAYTPKATVQAAIGGIPLALGFPAEIRCLPWQFLQL